MTTHEINIFFSVEVTFKSITDYTTKTLTFTNKPTEDVYATNWWPLLVSISGLGMAVGQSGEAVKSSGSVTLDDSWGGFGRNRRVSDLLARYTPITQTVTVKACNTQVNDQYPTNDYVTIWAGICSDVSVSTNGTITLSVEGNRTETKYANKIITSTTFPDAPSSSLGKSIPLVIGPTTVPAIATKFEETSGEYVWGTNRGATFVNGSISNYYCKDDDGEYLEVGSKTKTTAVAPTSPSSGSSYPTPSGLSECLVGWLTAGEKFIVVGGQWWFKGQGGVPSYSGNLIFRLYISNIQAADTYILVRETALAKSNYSTEIATTSDFFVKFKFDEPFVYNRNKHGFIHLSAQLTNYTGSTTDFVHGGTNASQTGYYTRATTGQFQANSSDWRPRHGLYGCEFTSSNVTTADEDGYGYSKFIVEQDTTSYPGGGTPYLSALEFAVYAQGLTDDGSGSITGGAGGNIQRPYDVIEMLSWKWNGSTWAADTSVWDFSALAAQNITANAAYTRTPQGYSSGNLTIQELIEQICTEHQMKVVQRVNGKLDVYLTGTAPTIAKVYTDENSIMQGWRILDPSSVINRIKVYYDTDLLNIQLESGLNSDSVGNYAQTLDWGLSTSAYTNYLTYASQQLYGRRELQEMALDFVATSTEAEALASIILAQYDLPHWIVQLEVPFWDNRTIELMDVVDLLSPRMPGYFGTSARATLPTVNGGEVDVIQGHYWKQARRYTCQVIGRDISFDRNEFPSILLTLRVIKPYHPHDPTVTH